MAVFPPLPGTQYAGHCSGEQPLITSAEGQRASPERTGDKKKFWAKLGQLSDKFLPKMITHFQAPQILFEL